MIMTLGELFGPHNLTLIVTADTQLKKHGVKPTFMHRANMITFSVRCPLTHVRGMVLSNRLCQEAAALIAPLN